MRAGIFPIRIHAEDFWLLPERAVFWPSEKILICSDLHWGRELFIQKHGVPIPEIVVHQERKFLQDLVAELAPAEWWILGDFIHQPFGLPDFFWQTLRDWCESLISKSTNLNSIRLVPGNHDRNFLTWTAMLPIEVEASGITRRAFHFRHEPETAAKKSSNDAKRDLFAWYGHLHPAISLPLLGQRKLPCFWIRESEAYLPAFSRLAGGQEVRPNFAIERAFAIAEGRILALPPP